MKNLKGYFVGLLAFSMLASCDKDDDGEPADNSDPNSELKAEIKNNYADIVYVSYQDALATAEALKTDIETFVASPSEITMENVKEAWLLAREAYGPTEAYRFSAGPIDDDSGPEGNLNAWPLDENYIDYVTGSNESGIINDLDTYPTIDAALLESLNEEGGEANISIGYHAIEFLLWGQDDANTALMTPGNRPYTDYVVGGTAENQDRRGQYLNLTVDILISNLEEMVDEWNPNESGNYYAELMAMSNNTFLTNVLTGIGTLSKSELAGERIFVALNNQNQEDEHSCFSDNTHRDIILNAQGIRNVYTGHFVGTNSVVVDGSSIQDLIGLVDVVLTEEMDDLSELTIQRTTAIPAPFDYALTQEVVGGDGPIMESVRALQDQGDKIAEVASALGLSISTDLPG